MLDIEVWTEREGDWSKIRHSFYEKPTTLPMVFHAKGAFEWRSKIVTMSEELRRRLRNSDKRHTVPELVEIVRKMSDSGYDPGARAEVLKPALRKF